MIIFIAFLVAIYILTAIRSLFLIWKTKNKQFWLIFTIQFLIILRGISLLLRPEATGNFLGQSSLSQFVLLSIGTVGLILIYLAEDSFFYNQNIVRELRESRSRFQRLIDQSPLAIQIVDQNGLMIDANPAWEALWHIHKKENLINNYNLFEDKQLIDSGFLESIREAQSGSTVFFPTYQYTYRNPKTNEKRTRWVRAYFYPFEADTTIENYALITEDITEQVVAKETIKESEDRWYQLVENYPEAVLISVNYKFVYCNPATVKIFGANSKDEILGKPLFDFNNEGKSKVLMERLALLDQGKPTPPHEHKMVGLDGVQRELISFSIPVTYRGEKAIQTVIRDVTEQNLNRRKLNHHEKLAAVGKLAAGIAHDFNNTLSVISLHSELLLRDEMLNPAHSKRVKVIHQQTKRAASLTSQILDFSRQAVIQLETVDLRKFFEKFIELLESILPETISIQLEEPTSEEKLNIEADKGRLQQLFMNLALNSRDALPAGGKITIELKKVHHTNYKEGAVDVIFVDNGNGIPDEIMAHLFEPFHTTKHRGAGTGLGLAQVYGIVSQHDGTIQVNSDEESGTTITVCFPLSPNKIIKTDSTSTEQFWHGNQETVLIVEDHEESRGLLNDLIKKLNYKTIVAENGQAALSLLEGKESDIHLILSDIVMPKLSGIEFAQRIFEKEMKIPIILMTGHPLTNQLDKISELNIIEILQKPLEVSKLSSALNAALKSV